MKQKGSRLTDTENKLVVTSGEGGIIDMEGQRTEVDLRFPG